MMQLLKHDHRGADSAKNCCVDKGAEVNGMKALEGNWLFHAGVLDQANSCHTGGESRVALSEVSGTNWKTWINSHRFEVHSTDLVIADNSFSLTPAGTWSSPSANSFIPYLNSHRVLRINTFNIFPTQGITFGGVNDCQSFVKEDHLRFSKAQVAQNYESRGNAPQSDRITKRAGVPGADIDSRKKEEKYSQANDVALGSKDRGIALADHVVIVAQKVEI